MSCHLRTLFNCGGWSQCELKSMHSAIKQALEERRATRVCAHGIRKTAYDIVPGCTDEAEHVLKVEVVGGAGLEFFLREPLYMQRHPEYCNCPKNMTVISLSSIGCVPQVRAIDHTLEDELQLLAGMPRHILLWEEERAEVCDIFDFCTAADQTDGRAFHQKTLPILASDGFNDLTEGNVGQFRTAPRYRWIDVSPDERYPSKRARDDIMTSLAMLPTPAQQQLESTPSMRELELPLGMQTPYSFFGSGLWLQAQRNHEEHIMAKRLAQLVNQRANLRANARHRNSWSFCNFFL